MFGSCSNRTEQTFVVRLKNRTRTIQGACSVRFAYLSNTNRDEQALRCSVRFGSVRRAHSEFLTSHSNKSRYTIACKAENCPWHLHATSVHKTPAFQIKTLHSDHSCYGINHSGNNAATATFVAKYVAQKLKQPEYRPIDIIKDIQRQQGVEITYNKAFRA